MDRQIVYVGAIPQDTDLLLTNKHAMYGVGFLAQAVLGTSTLVDGLSCTPTGPASLQVDLSPGSIYAFENVDSTAYGSIAANTTNQMVKQGIVLGTLTLPTASTYFAAPSTAGYSVNYLIEVEYQDVDAGSTVLPYYNSSNPAVAYNGPNNTGVSQNTVRQGQCVVAIKTGTAATTGTQVTPTPDAGYTGLWVITVANGQTSITSGNIAAYSGAPFITNKLTALAPLASPALTGTPTVPTASPGTNTTQAASTAFVQTAIAGTTNPNAGPDDSVKGVWASNTGMTFTFNSGVLKNGSGGFVSINSFSETLATGTTGAGGLDTGSLAASTWYHVYAIYKPSTTTQNILFSTSATAPTLPSGYTYFCKIGTFTTDGSSNIKGIQQNNRTSSFSSGHNLSGLPQIWSGTHGDPTVPTWTTVALPIPATASVIYFGGGSSSSSNTGIIAAPNSNYGNTSSSSNPSPYLVTSVQYGAQGRIQLETPQQMSIATQSSTYGFCIGYDDQF